MNALEIARREFVARLRHEPPYLSLLSVVAIALLAGVGASWWVSTNAPRQEPYLSAVAYLGSSGLALSAAMAAHRGAEVALPVSLLLLILALLLGPVVASGALNRQRDGRAVEGLLLTGASPVGIVLGKVAAALLRTLLVLGAATPSFAIAWQFGGISLAIVAATLAVVVALALFGSTVGVLMSLIIQDNVRAIVYSYLLLALVVALPPLAFVVLLWMGKASDWLQALYYSSPVLTLLLPPNLLAAFQPILPSPIQVLAKAGGQTWQGVPFAGVYLAATTFGYVVFSFALAALGGVLLDPCHPFRQLRRRLKLGVGRR